jgi:GPI mannosyltransferase 3
VTAAASGLTAGEAGTTAAPTGARLSRDRRALVGAALCCVVLLAVGLRLVPTVFMPSMNWGDEIFQTIEPAHRVVYGYGLVPWEFQLGMRSWLLPGAVAGLIETARIVGDGPQYYLPAIALGLGLLASTPVVCVFLWCRGEFGHAGALVAAAAIAVAPELVYFGARALNEVVAAHLLVVGLYLADPGRPAPGARRRVAAGFLLGIVCLLRLQLAPAAALVALWPALPDQGEWRSRFSALVAGGVAALAAGAVLDWLTLGYPLASVWRNLYDNLYLGISSGFSVAPWWYYLVGELGVWLAAAPFVVLLIALGARRMPMLFAAAALIVAVHSAIPHKEYRFIYPAIMLLSVLAAVGLAQLTQLTAAWLALRGLRQTVAVPVAATLLTGLWCAAAGAMWSGGALAQLRQRAHDELLAMSYVHDLPAPPCGVGLYGKNAWVRYGGYSYLHRPVPLFWPATPAELAAESAGFDTLLYDRDEHLPPSGLGFRPLRCFGHVCVARRPGACAALPPPAMWFPTELRDRMPSENEFAPVPPTAARP